MTTPTTDRVVGLGQATVEQIGVGPRSSEAVVELETFSIQAGGAVGTTLATRNPSDKMATVVKSSAS